KISDFLTVHIDLEDVFGRLAEREDGLLRHFAVFNHVFYKTGIVVKTTGMLFFATRRVDQSVVSEIVHGFRGTAFIWYKAVKFQSREVVILLDFFHQRIVGWDFGNQFLSRRAAPPRIMGVRNKDHVYDRSPPKEPFA